MGVAALLKKSKRPVATANPANTANPKAELAGLAPLAVADAPSCEIDALAILNWTKGLSGPPRAPRAFDQSAMRQIKREGAALVWSQVFEQWMVWVRSDAIRRTLEDVNCPLPIYTLAELRIASQLPADALRAAHTAKTEFGATIHPLNHRETP